MTTKRSIAKNIDEYVAEFPKDIQEILEKIRALIKQAAPEAEEVISYGMPTFKLNGNLVHFAAFKHHIGFYPTPSGTETFKKEIARFKAAKGSIQFPLDEPIPYALINDIIKFRVNENLEKAQNKKKHK